MTDLDTAMTPIDLVDQAVIAAVALDFPHLTRPDAVQTLVDTRLPQHLRDKYDRVALVRAVAAYVAEHLKTRVRAGRRAKRDAARTRIADVIRTEQSRAVADGDAARADYLAEAASLVEPPVSWLIRVKRIRSTTALLIAMYATVWLTAIESGSATLYLAGIAGTVVVAYVVWRDVRAPKPTERANPTSSAAQPRNPLWVTKTLIVVNVLVFAIIALQAASILPADLAATSIFRASALDPHAVAAGAWALLVTGGFVHSGLTHLLLNMFSLGWLGAVAEPRLGRLRYLGVYVASLLGGALAVQFLSGQITVGASGAVYGVAGALVAATIVDRANPTGLLIMIGINLGISFLIPGISYWAHLGGLATGIVTALALIRLGATHRHPHLPAASHTETITGEGANR
ncbi:rhomboid family intramembrane serine protease [Nocardia transvalensis]|uniref:rhomboid family intramembrane serine protease n=1 Tax=Nocardia transvalensis TaxID=37333 RepID=UPI00189615FD|nr:rhomboid family intramembrane serine protease [Nocardia transvalensis]MBF6333653.1 rhomboid family intramembrane serine protease [Nocardia transvalensis]